MLSSSKLQTSDFTTLRNKSLVNISKEVVQVLSTVGR